LSSVLIERHFPFRLVLSGSMDKGRGNG
jgi:hypothetical protein